MSGSYDDIINLPHPVSERHARMSMHDRAAQFSPFAALTGYDAAVKETARLTDTRIELTEEERAILDAKLRKVIETKETVCITYFVPDERKNGGAYVRAVGQVKKIDSVNGTVRLADGQDILIGELFLIAKVESDNH